MKKNIHSPDTTKRGHRLWQRTLTVSDDGGRIVNVERLTHARTQCVLITGCGQTQARNQGTHGNIPHAIMRRAVRTRDARAIQHERHPRTMESNIHEELVETTVQERRIERDNGMRTLVGHTGCGSHGLGLGDADVDHATRVGLVHRTQTDRAHHRRGNADDIVARSRLSANLIGEHSGPSKTLRSDGQAGLRVDRSNRVEAICDIFLCGSVSAPLLRDHMNEDGLAQRTRPAKRSLHRRNVMTVDGPNVFEAEVFEHHLGNERILDAGLQAVQRVVGRAAGCAVTEEMLFSPGKRLLVTRRGTQSIEMIGESTDRRRIRAPIVVHHNHDATILRRRDVVECLPCEAAGQRAIADDTNRPRAITPAVLFP